MGPLTCPSLCVLVTVARLSAPLVSQNPSTSIRANLLDFETGPDAAGEFLFHRYRDPYSAARGATRLPPARSGGTSRSGDGLTLTDQAVTSLRVKITPASTAAASV